MTAATKSNVFFSLENESGLYVLELKSGGMKNNFKISISNFIAKTIIQMNDKP
jgi:hypothetical protein